MHEHQTEGRWCRTPVIPPACIGLVLANLVAVAGSASARLLTDSHTVPVDIQTTLVSASTVQPQPFVPFDTELGLLKRATIDLQATTVVSGSALAPVTSSYALQVDHDLRGLGSGQPGAPDFSYFDFADPISQLVPGMTEANQPAPIAANNNIRYIFSTDAINDGTVQPTISSGVIPSFINTSFADFSRSAHLPQELQLAQSVSTNLPLIDPAQSPVTLHTTGTLTMEYGYLPFGTETRIIDPLLPGFGNVPPIPAFDRFPTNSQRLSESRRIDTVFHQEAVARADRDGLDLGLRMIDRVLDGNMMEGYARGAVAYEVDGVASGGIIPASFQIEGSGAVGGLGQAYLEFGIFDGDSNTLAFFNVTFDEDGSEFYLLENCRPDCGNDTGGATEITGTWRGLESVDFLLSIGKEEFLDVVMYGFAINGTGEPARLDFLNTAALSIVPQPGVSVTLSTGQVFEAAAAVQEPATLGLFLSVFLLFVLTLRARDHSSPMH